MACKGKPVLRWHEGVSQMEDYMTHVTGKSVSKGIAIGKIKVISNNPDFIVRRKIKDVEAELERFENARTKAKATIADLSKECIDPSISSIFSAYELLLDDAALVESITNKIVREKVNAEYAVAISADTIALTFSNMEDETFRTKGNDIKDLSERLINLLQGNDNRIDLGDEPVILVADDLTPSQILKLDKSKLLAFATKKGSYNCHTAIIARSLALPALCGVFENGSENSFVDSLKALDGRAAILDGNKGLLIIDPTDEQMAEYAGAAQKQMAECSNTTKKQAEKSVEVVGSCSFISVFANITGTDDLPVVTANGADGIGLFRTEFLYLEKNTFPTEDEQFEVYKTVLEAMKGKKVIIRTLDIGADKKLDYLDLGKEENPALGLRAIRVSLTNPEIFKTQLRALYRASVFGNLAIMYPMISSVDEVLKAKEISRQVREELIMEGIQIGKCDATIMKERHDAIDMQGVVEEGIMIETPAAAIMSDELARYVDFFSIGTNDLTQYTLAMDRQDSKLDGFFDAKHPAVLRLIKLVSDNAHKAGIPVGICGELASDTSLTGKFVEMGIDELSVSPSLIADVRRAIRG